MSEFETIIVCPTRLASGRWSHEFNRQVGEGDISASYSADCIGLGKPICKPFNHAGKLWVSIGTSTFGSAATKTVRAYALIAQDAFDGSPTTYRAKLDEDGGDTARHDPNGFYHGMTVRRGKDHLIMCGPPALFVPGEIRQPLLFDL